MFRKQGDKRTKNYTHEIEMDKTTFILFMKLFPLWLIYMIEPHGSGRKTFNSTVSFKNCNVCTLAIIKCLYFDHNTMKSKDTVDKILNILAQTQEGLLEEY